MGERQEKAIELHDKGYNCAQSVVCAYCDLFGLDEETAYKMAEGFGLGMGLMEVCGALTGGFMLAGCKLSAGTDAPGKTKGQTYRQTRAMGEAFSKKNGTMLCRELKGVDTGKVILACPDCIREGCALVEEMLLKETK